MTEQEELDRAVLEYRLHWLNEAIKSTAQDLARAAMSGYTPSAEELLNYAKWLFGADQAFIQEAENIIEKASEEQP